MNVANKKNYVTFWSFHLYVKLVCRLAQTIKNNMIRELNNPIYELEKLMCSGLKYVFVMLFNLFWKFKNKRLLNK